MGFWKKVDDYLKYKGISRKELASGTGIKNQTLDRAIQRDSEPKIAEGLKVCQFLNVDVSTFLDQPIKIMQGQSGESQDEIQTQLALYRKHHALIENFEKINHNYLHLGIKL